MKKAFTLAEVLITLGVIGVVAAMTIPTLIANYQKVQTVNRLKQTYAIINNAIRLTANDFGGDGMNSWSCDGRTDTAYLGERCFGIIFDKVRLSQKFPKITSTDRAMCYQGKDYKPYSYLNGARNLKDKFCTNGHSVLLANGACVHWLPFYWTGTSNQGGCMFIDINGPYSGVNMLGRDTFRFCYGIGQDQKNPVRGPGLTIHASQLSGRQNDNGLVTPVSRKNLLNDCSKYNTGFACSELIVKDGWKISDDYPWR